MASRQLMYLRNSFVQYLCSDDIVKIMLNIYPLFLFWFWYSSCFDVKCWFHTFPNRYTHISMGVLILFDHRDFHVNSFQPVCLLFKLFHTDVVEKSDDLSVSFIPSCLCFPHPRALFFIEPEILKWNIHFIHVIFLHSFPSMFLSGALSWRCSRASSSSFFCSQILPVDVIQDFGVDLILFLISQCFLIPVHQLIILLLLFISGVLKISQKIHNSILNPFKLFWALSSYSSHLIQPVHYLLSNLFQRWFLWVGP